MIYNYEQLKQGGLIELVSPTTADLVITQAYTVDEKTLATTPTYTNVIKLAEIRKERDELLLKVKEIDTFLADVAKLT